MEILVYLIPAFLALGAASSGWMRMAARSFAPPAISLVMLMVSAVACWGIGAQKTGGMFAGLGSTLLAMLLGVGAAGLIAGAILRRVHEVLHQRIKGHPAPARPTPDRPWDAMALCALSVIAVGLSLLE